MLFVYFSEEQVKWNVTCWQLWIFIGASIICQDVKPFTYMHYWKPGYGETGNSQVIKENIYMCCSNMFTEI